MRPPRYRVRTLLIAVAAVALSLGGGLGIVRRRADLHRRALHHEQHWAAYANEFRREPAARMLPDGVLMRKAKWHAELREKYLRASRWPFLPVVPDPPPPA